MDWIQGLGVDNQNAVILWMYGPAGAGKSAIAHEIAHRCDLMKLLLASFFFSRSDSTRSNAKLLVATISYQIAINIPGTREKIVATIEQDPLILTRSLKAQLTSLIVEPLREPLEAGYFNAPTSRRLIIIDGLDECVTPAVQCSVLEAISLLFHEYHLPLLILIASRSERHITHSFTTGTLPNLHTTLALDDTYEPDHDIRLFLTDNFRQVRETHPMRRYLDHSWPSVEVLEQLVQKSSGQFIYASTVVKYVSSIRHQPADRLNVVLGIRPPRYTQELPFSELDALYIYIFSAVEDRETVLRILGVHLVSSSWSWSADLPVPDLERFLFLNGGDIEMLFGDLSSVIAISSVHSDICIEFLHASLQDFLLDATRSREFHIDMPNIHTICMHLCFDHIKQRTLSYFPSKQVAGYSRLIDPSSKDHSTYAALNLIRHCQNTPPSASSQVREEIINFSLHRPDSCFANTGPEISLFLCVPRFLEFIKTLVCPRLFPRLIHYTEQVKQPVDDIDQIYNQKLTEVLNFFTSKLQLYYSSSRLTLLLTLLDIPPNPLCPDPTFWLNIPFLALPSRLKMMDSDALSLGSVSRFPAVEWEIFREFLDSGHPLALDGQRRATAASACLKFIFIHDQAPHSRRTPRVVQRSQRHRADPKPKGLWHQSPIFLSRFGRYFSRQVDQQNSRAFSEFQGRIQAQHFRSEHFIFLLENSGYSDNLLNFSRRRVFRPEYLRRKHPIYMKKAIFALAKYIRRVTGETAEVMACKSIWGRKRWFTVQEVSPFYPTHAWPPMID